MRKHLTSLGPLWLFVALAALWYSLNDVAHSAAPPVPVTFVNEAAYVPLTGTMQKLTGLDTKQSLTVPAAARRCVFFVEGDAVRFSDDGTDPDPSTKVGGEIAAGQQFGYAGNLAAVELKGSATTIVHVLYYGP